MRLPLILLLCATPAVAQNLAPETTERPQPRPVEDVQPTEEVQPSEDDEVVPAVPETPDDVTPVTIATGQRDLLMLRSEDEAACLARLDDLGVVYQSAPAIVPDDDRDCGILQPLSVSSVAPDVSLSPPAMVRCLTAEAIAVWTRDFVLPAAERLVDRGALTVIENGSGYVCRRRNNASDGKLSEHAFGNALDVMGFQFAEGPPIKIEPREAEGSMAEAFQDAVRAAACLEFTTVLGPGSNAQHDDHLHLDIVARGSGYRLCEQGGASID